MPLRKQTPKRSLSLQLHVGANSDGEIKAIYIYLRKIRSGQRVQTAIVQKSALLVDYDRRGTILGIEVLAPVNLSDILSQVPEPDRTPFRRFLDQCRPNAFIVR